MGCKYPGRDIHRAANNLELWNHRETENERAGETLGTSMQRAAPYAKKTVMKEGRSGRKREEKHHSSG